MGATVVLRLPGPLTDDVVRSSSETLRARLSAGGVTRVVCHLDRVGSDLAAVDALARLALTARRAGAAFDLHGSDADLSALLHLVGLSAPLLGAAEA